MKLQEQNENQNQKDVKSSEPNGLPINSPNESKKDQQLNNSHPERNKFVFFIEKQKFETDQRKLTAREILQLANVNESSKTLAVKQQGGFYEYKDLNEVITFGPALHFVLFDNQPTPVS